MSTCQSCGGVIGRDCFNPQECMDITRQQAAAFESQGDVQGELEHLRARVKELEAKAAIVDWLEANDEYFDFGREYLFSMNDTPWPQELTNGSIIQCAVAIMKHKDVS